MTWNSIRIATVAFICGMLLLHCGSALAGQCAQNPKMPATTSETIFLNAGLDGDGGIHYWFSWGLPEGLQVWQTVPFEPAEYCYCEEEDGVCDIDTIMVPAPSPGHVREPNTECFWIDEDEDGFLDDCRDAAAHNAHC